MMKSSQKAKLYGMLMVYRAYFKVLSAVAPGQLPRQAFRVFSTPFNKKVRDRERVALAAARHSEVEANGETVKVYAWGGGGKTALLIHGWEGNAGSFGGFVDMLLAEGYQVFAFDGPAHGQSGGKNTNLFRFSDAIQAVAAAMPAPPNLVVAHSFGSGATAYALANGKLPTPEKLVLLTIPDRFEDIFASFARMMRMGEKGKNGMFKYLKKTYGVDIGDMVVSNLALDMTVQKTLIVHSPADKVVPFRWSEKVAGNWPNAAFYTPAAIGHYRMLWEPAVLGHVKEFIAT